MNIHETIGSHYPPNIVWERLLQRLNSGTQTSQNLETGARIERSFTCDLPTFGGRVMTLIADIDACDPMKMIEATIDCDASDLPFALKKTQAGLYLAATREGSRLDIVIDAQARGLVAGVALKGLEKSLPSCRGRLHRALENPISERAA